MLNVLIAIALIQAIVSYAYYFLTKKKADYDSQISSVRWQYRYDEEQIERCIDGHERYREMIAHLVELETIEDPMRHP